MRAETRLERLEQSMQARRAELWLSVRFTDEVCTGLMRCHAALDAPTYERVEKVLREHAEEVSPWLVLRRG